MTLTIGIKSAESGLTFGELRAFVADAMRANTPDDAVVRARVTFRGAVRSLEVTGERAGEPGSE